MDYKTKRRLIVAIIIIALAVIFLPIPFSKHKAPVATSFEQTPTPPSAEAPKILKQESPEAIQKNFQAQGSVIPESPLPSQGSSQASSQAAPQAQTPVQPQPVQQPAQKVVQKRPAPKLVQLPPMSKPEDSGAPIPPPPVIVDEQQPVKSAAKKIHHAAHPHKIAASGAARSPFGPIHVRRSSASSEPDGIEQAAAQQSAYVIQLASFQKISQARGLVARLREAGYVAFVQDAEVHGHPYKRVYVGPFTQEQQAKAMLHMIHHKLNLQGYVHSFQPAKMTP